MNVLREAWHDLGGIFRLGLRVLGQHWPQLLALYLSGAAARLAMLWLAIWISRFSSLAATLLLPLSSLCMLLAMVVMFRVCAESLPFTQQQEANDDRRWKSHLRLASQVLVPFLAVYASEGLLREDSRRFIYDITADEGLNNFLAMNFGRQVVDNEGLILGIVLVALTVRKWISLHRLTEKTVGWGLIGGYVEGLWLVTLGVTLTSQLAALQEWVTSRAVVAGIAAQYEALKELPGLVAQTLVGIIAGMVALIGQMGNLVIAPVAWLAIAAMIYGGKLTERDLPTHEQVTERLKRLPNPVLQLLSQAAEPVVTPIKNTLTAIGKLAGAGVPGMVLFCVSFALAGHLSKILVAYLARLLLGPQSASWLEAITPYLLLAERGVYLIVTVVLVSAAVNHVLIAERAHQLGTRQPEIPQPSLAASHPSL